MINQEPKTRNPQTWTLNPVGYGEGGVLPPCTCMGLRQLLPDASPSAPSSASSSAMSTKPNSPRRSAVKKVPWGGGGTQVVMACMHVCVVW